MKVLIALMLCMFVNMASAEGSSDNLRTISASADVGLEKYGSFKVRDSSSGMRFELDATESVKSFSGHFGSKDGVHRGSAGILFKNYGTREATGLRGKYSLNLPLHNGEVIDLLSESSVGAGVVMGKYILPQSNSATREFYQFLYGVKQSIGIRVGESQNVFGLKASVEGTYSSHNDDYGSMSQWDSRGVGVDAYFSSSFSEKLMLRMKGSAMKKQYNPELYFFVEDWVNEIQMLSEIVYGPYKHLDIIPSFNWRRLDIERNGRADLERPEFGTMLVLKDLSSYGINIFAKGVHAPWRHKRGGETLLSLGFRTKSSSLEAYHRTVKDQYSSFKFVEKMTGVKLTWKFGSREMESIDDYGSAYKDKYKFFQDDGLTEHSELPRKKQTERLENPRKRNEWSGSHYRWQQATGMRTPQEVYDGRGGDCDEQACANVSMDNQNGYEAYNLAYWDFSQGNVGHAVSIVKDKYNGQWFLDEYGVLHKIDVAPNADRDTVARAALAQTNGHLALRIVNGSHAWMQVGNCPSDGLYYMSNMVKVGSVPRVTSRPKLEYGHERFTKRDFLFSY
ncbi:hypothetical protein GW950_00085 [Candidatus Wolfebacteria bacterium]|nr:hypothetical protein [Candidatus Wolfebacteria bacterium]